MKTPEEKRAYYRAYYQAHKEKFREKRLRWEAKVRGLVLTAKTIPCADCGRSWHPLVMEFDHLPGTEKRTDIGHARARKWGRRKIQEEMAKCQVFCPTCHRIRTLQRLGLID